MMRSSLLLLPLLLYTCNSKSQYSYPAAVTQSSTLSQINPAGTTIAQRFLPPPGYRRPAADPASFASYLRQLPLQPDGSPVHYYNGELKRRTDVYCAVVRLDVGNKDLQQCADAVMRLRGEYLFAQQRWHELGFRFVRDTQMHYFSETGTDRSYARFRKWMDQVFAYASTRSLYAQLHPKSIRELAPGDVLIQKGDPYGHAVIVVDMAIHDKTGHKIFLLAQSYMPAQEIHLLRNPATTSPWYSIDTAGTALPTPEWDFTTGDLRCF